MKMKNKKSTPPPTLPQHREPIEANSISMADLNPNPSSSRATKNPETGPQVAFAEDGPAPAPQLVPDVYAVVAGEIQPVQSAPSTAESRYVITAMDAGFPGRRSILSRKAAILTIGVIFIIVVGIAAAVAAIFTGNYAKANEFRGDVASNGSNRGYLTAGDVDTGTWTSDGGMLLTDTVDFKDYFSKATAYPTTLPLPSTGTATLLQNILTTSTTSGRPVTILADPTVASLPTGTVYALPTGTLPLPLQHEATNNQCADEYHAIGLGPCDPFLFGVEITALEYGYVLSTFPQPLFTNVLLDYPVGDRPWSGSSGGIVEHAFAGTVSKTCKTYKQYNVWFGKYGEVWLHLTHTLPKTCLIEKEDGEKINIQPTLCECSWSGVLPV